MVVHYKHLLDSYLVYIVYTPTAPSGYPQNVQAQSVSPTEIWVSWNPIPQLERNGKIIQFEVLLNSLTFPGDVVSANMSPENVLMLLVENLEEYAEYNISVRAFTKVGPGPFSPTETERTLESSKYCNVVREMLVHSYIY